MPEIFVTRNKPGEIPVYLLEDGTWTEDLNDPSVKRFSSCKKAWNEKWDLRLPYGNICIVEEGEDGTLTEKEVLDAFTLRFHWKEVA